VRDDNARFKRAREIARNTSVDSKAFSKQGFYLLHKIVEVDGLLRVGKKLRERVFETHPEVAFWMLNCKRSLSLAKKSNRGIEMRQKILIDAGFSSITVNAAVPDGAARDDLLDALACAAVARRIHAGKAQRFPAQPKRDSVGLQMAIWA
jgi:predicted RNase H-like nuclease